MAILTSLYTGISGLNSNGAALSVIGDNIANMNTTGFKAAKANFGDVLSSTFSGGSGASQIGRGSFLSSVSPQFSQGSFETTANGLDLAVDGSGFLIVQAADGTRNYTRAGSMRLDRDGFIVNPEGLSLLGYQFDATGASTGVIDTLNIASLSSSPSTTGNIRITANLDSRSGGNSIIVDTTNNTIIFNDGATRTATLTPGTYTADQLATEITTQMEAANGGTDTYTVSFDSDTQRFTIVNDTGNTNSIDIEWENAGTTATAILGFTSLDHPAIAVAASTTSDEAVPLYQPAFDVANPSNTSNFSSSITVYDSLGNAHQVTVYFRKDSVSSTGNQWEWFAVIPASEATSGINTIGSQGTINFSSSGAYAGMTTSTPSFDFIGGAAQGQAINMDLTALTQYGSTSATVFQNQDGFGSGALQSVSISSNGIITGVFTNGQTRGVGQIALAKFVAPEGLTKQGNNLFTESYDSGPPVIGEPESAGQGSVLSSTLELSNVDLANEFVGMISAQRGFQANSRVVTATDEIMQELVNMTR